MQLEFPIGDKTNLQNALEAQTSLSIDLVITDNRSSMLAFQPGRRKATLRLHRMFLSAGPEVVNALGLWLKRGKCKRSAKVIDRFIDEHRHLVDAAKPKNRIRLRPQGEVYDLQELYAEVNDEHFDGSIDVPITWGKAPASKKRRRYSIRLGSYSPEDHLVRIHPYLDNDAVPRFFIRYIVFHELLHAHLGIEKTSSGRRIVHSREFNTIERSYPDYTRAVEWQNNPRNLGMLLKKKAS